MPERLRILFTLVALLLQAGCANRPAQDIWSCTIIPPAEPVICTMQYDPVCGCDGKTYSNACTARGAGVPSSRPGSCEGDEAR